VSNGLSTLIRPGGNEVLVNGKHGEGNSMLEGRLLEPVQIRWRFIGHLAVKHFNTIEAQTSRIFNYFLDWITFFLEVPIGIARHAEAGSGFTGCSWGKTESAGGSGKQSAP